jgi:alpha-tubulin suppressor-like RCC1 family protein
MAACLVACGGDGGPNMMPDGGMGGDGGGSDAPPTTRFLATPPIGQTNGVPSAFELGCSDADCTFECSLDDGPYAACDATVAFDALAPGSHSLAVRATDASGNVESAPPVHQWTLGFGYRSVVANDEAACAISGDGALYCWGSDDDGLRGDGPTEADPTATPMRIGTASDWEELFAGSETFCGRRDGALYCWGSSYAFGNEGGDTVDAPMLFSSTLVSIDASYDAACGLDATGALYCVGDGEDGLLGDGITQDEHYVEDLIRVGTDLYTQVAVGDEHACAIRADGRIGCWGRQPVVDTVLAVPTLSSDVSTWSRVAAGDNHTCAIKTNGELYCWGRNYSGQLGLGNFLDVVQPTRVGSDSDWVEVSASENGTCAIKQDGRGLCWGANYTGQLGSLTVSLADAPTPIPVSATTALRAITGNADTQCAQSELGQVLCWGSNDSGILGRGVLPRQETMTLIDDQFDYIATTQLGGCGLASGSLLCWGSTQTNGDPAGLPRVTPTAVTADTDWTHVTVSTQHAGHACGIRAGSLYCWGNNSSGQLGTGDTTSSLVPVQVTVTGVVGWKHVSAGVLATCAVTTNGSLYCWGSNVYGQLGVGDTEPRLLPTQVALSNWDTVEMGNYRVGARGSNGTFYYWGVNAGPSPTQVTGTDWALVDNTGFGECGIKTNGTLHCTLQAITPAFQAGTATDWVGLVGPGYPYCALNSQGAVGCFVNNGSNNGFMPSPAIDSSTGWTQLVNHDDAACGLRNGTERHCRGNRFLGSLGDGFDERLPTPILTP